MKSANFIELECKECGEVVEKVDSSATAITCNMCVTKITLGWENITYVTKETTNEVEC